MEVYIVNCKQIICVILCCVCFHIVSIAGAYIKMYGCDDMWRCKSSRNLCIQLITRNVIILVMFLIFSIAYAFLGSEKAFEHFSFASTVTSIILSLLAIILTLDSEAKNEAVKGMVDKSLVHMNENTKKLERYGEKFDDIKPLLEKILSYATDTNTRVKTEQFNAAVNSNLVFEYKREDADCGK